MKVNEIFKSIQGEGANLGKEVVFVRLSGCNLDCEWCDTEHFEYTEMPVKKIGERVKSFGCNNVIFTGGEPTLQDLNPLIIMLVDFWIGIESNGYDIKKYVGLVDYIACSPKEKLDYCCCDEIRLVNDNLTVEDVLYYENFNIEHKFLAVKEENCYFNLRDTINLLAEVNERVAIKWRLNEQYHKRLNIR